MASRSVALTASLCPARRWRSARTTSSGTDFALGILGDQLARERSPPRHTCPSCLSVSAISLWTIGWGSARRNSRSMPQQFFEPAVLVRECPGRVVGDERQHLVGRFRQGGGIGRSSVAARHRASASAISSSAAAAASCGLIASWLSGRLIRLAHHLEEVGGLLPLQQRIGQRTVSLRSRLRRKQLFVKRLGLVVLARLPIAIGQNVLERDILRVAPRGRLQPRGDLLFAIQAP